MTPERGSLYVWAFGGCIWIIAFCFSGGIDFLAPLPFWLTVYYYNLNWQLEVKTMTEEELIDALANEYGEYVRQ